MTLSFRTRLTLQWSLAFGLLLAVANVATYAAIRAFLLSDLDADLRTVAATELASAADSDAGAHLHEFTPDPADPDYNQKFVQLIDRNGQIIMQSPRLRASRPLLPPAVIVAAFGGQASVLRVTANDRPGRMIALRTLGDKPYLVAVGLFTDRVDATLAWLRRLLIAVWVGSMLLTGAIGFVLASHALRPIRRITARAAAIAHGDAVTRLDVAGADDEIGRMTRLLNEMLERLFQAIEANRRFASDASHELRTPLTALIGEVEVTLKRPRTVDEYRQTLAYCQERLHHLSRLVEDLMLLVRAQEQKASVRSEVAIAALLERIVARRRDAIAAADAAVSIEVAPELAAYADERLLEHVFDNVIANALQYGGRPATVEIGGSLEQRSGGAPSEAVITVRDNGPGIPKEERERVFERFYRVDASRSRRTGGTGLGLSIAREIVQLFTGTIRIVDGTGTGTTVEIRLPGGRLVS
jgi:two-component system OmpR family sensor kinase